jgi:hypothetical protein
MMPFKISFYYRFCMLISVSTITALSSLVPRNIMFEVKADSSGTIASAVLTIINEFPILVSTVSETDCFIFVWLSNSNSDISLSLDGAGAITIN